MSDPKFFAPTMLHRDTSTLIFAITNIDMVEVLQNELSIPKPNPKP
jgi:hypothetical protein